MKILPPKNVKDVRPFLGIINFIKNYIHGRAGIMQPITKLQRKANLSCGMSNSKKLLTRSRKWSQKQSHWLTQIPWRDSTSFPTLAANTQWEQYWYKKERRSQLCQESPTRLNWSTQWQSKNCSQYWNRVSTSRTSFTDATSQFTRTTRTWPTAQPNAQTLQSNSRWSFSTKNLGSRLNTTRARTILEETVSADLLSQKQRLKRTQSFY